MTEQSEQWTDRAWKWVLKITGLGVFVYAAVIDGTVSFGLAFLGICLAVLPVDEVAALLRGWRRNGRDSS